MSYKQARNRGTRRERTQRNGRSSSEIHQTPNKYNPYGTGPIPEERWKRLMAWLKEKSTFKK